MRAKFDGGNSAQNFDPMESPQTKGFRTKNLFEKMQNLEQVPMENAN